METDFTPWSALLGGLLIGAASVGLMAIHGRIAGISGLLGKLLPPYSAGGLLADKTALGFVIGLVIALPFFVLLTGADISVWMPSLHFKLSRLVLSQASALSSAMVAPAAMAFAVFPAFRPAQS